MIVQNGPAGHEPSRIQDVKPGIWERIVKNTATEPRCPNVVEGVELRFPQAANDVLKLELAVTIETPAPSIRSIESDE